MTNQRPEDVAREWRREIPTRKPEEVAGEWLIVARAEWVDLISRLAACQQESEKGECGWFTTGDGVWEATCGFAWELTNEEGPIENGMCFCPNCGGELCVS